MTAYSYQAVTSRLQAFNMAQQMLGPEATFTDVATLADRIYKWSEGVTVPTSIRLTVGPVRKQQPEVEEIPVQIHDDEEFDLGFEAVDAKGFKTVDVFESSVDNADSVTLVPAEDGNSVTVRAGNPGSAVVTVTDGTVTVTEAVDVLPAGAVLINLVEGAVRKQAQPE